MTKRQAKGQSMGKGDRRGKGKGNPFPLGAIKPARHRGGQRGSHKSEDARAQVLDIRAKRAGLRGEPKALRDAVSAPWMGEPIGMCMAYIAPSEAARLWDIWTRYCKACRDYRALCLSATGGPQSAALPMLPEPFEADPTSVTDLRTEDERAADARRAYHYWQNLINGLPVYGGLAIYQTERGTGRTLWADEPTAWGKAAIGALQDLSKQMA